MIFGRCLWVLSISFFLCSCSPSEGNKNVKMCQSLNAVISQEELFKQMGQPYKIEATDKGTVLHYESNPFAGGPVRILEDAKTGRIIGKKCFEDEEWVYLKEVN